MDSKIFRTILFIFSYYIITCAAQSKWVSPHEMVNDGGEAEGVHSVADGQQCSSECVDVKRRLVTCESKLNTIERQTDHKNPTLVVMHHFKKFLGNLSDNFCFLKLNDHERFQIKFKFTQDQCKNLASFALTPSIDPQILHAIQETLSNFIKTSEQVSDIEFPSKLSLFTNFCMEHFYGILTVLFVVAISVNSLWVFSRIVITRKLIVASLAVLFIISIPWNWWYMYKKKEASKMATMAMAGFDDPCSKSMWRRFTSSLFFQKDECVSHAEAHNVHAAFEVSPLAAVSVTISTVFLEPLEYIGGAINKLIASSIEGLPFFMQWLILILVFMFAIFGLFFACGYNFRTIFFSIGPEGRRNKEVEDVRRQNYVLESKILELENKLKFEHRNDSIGHSGGGDSSPSTPSILPSPTSDLNTPPSILPSPPSDFPSPTSEDSSPKSSGAEIETD